METPAVGLARRRLSIRDTIVKIDPIMPHMIQQVVITWRHAEGDTPQSSE
jgi:hypothetical protein